jgi:hypothetical protein
VRFLAGTPVAIRPACGTTPGLFRRAEAAKRHCQTNLGSGTSLAARQVMTQPSSPFRYFNSSPEIIRIAVMMLTCP